MRFGLIILAGMLAFHAFSQIKVEKISVEPVLKVLPLGDIRPSGWIKEQMRKDMDGFVGHLDEIVPALMSDSIYGSERLHKGSVLKELGNLREGDAQGDEQYKWWNSETQSNWWDGYIRNAFLLGDERAVERCRERVEYILSTQDDDGYIGIYDKSLRYGYSGENGELWAKATLFRGLIAYYEFTGDERVWTAVVRAVDNLMENWPVNASAPFDTGEAYNGGVGHGLVFTDVLDSMYRMTGDRKYEDYALFLYLDYSKWFQWEQDAQLKNILDENYKLKCHGVHTYEHLRPVAVAAGASDDPELKTALNLYLKKIHSATTVPGGAIGDEWVGGRDADATDTGYEFCSSHELMDSYGLLLRRTGNAAWGEQIENIFYNAALGAKHPERGLIAYLKTDNSYEMTGTRNGAADPNQKQTRYKYSPAHQDAAVCCVPNAGRIIPYFLQNAWMVDASGALVANVLMPSVLDTEVGGKRVSLRTVTAYPFDNSFTFSVKSEGRVTLKIRVPSWADRVDCSAGYELRDGYVVIDGDFSGGAEISLSFDTKVRVVQDAKGVHYFAYGANFYAYPIKSEEIKGREYAPGYADYYYKAKEKAGIYRYLDDNGAVYEKGKIVVRLGNVNTGKIESVELVPLGKTVLRQAAF